MLTVTAEVEGLFLDLEESQPFGVDWGERAFFNGLLASNFDGCLE